MSPKPQFRSLKKKATTPTETNSPSVNTEVDSSKTIENSETKTKQVVTSPEAKVTLKETTSKELQEETGDQAKSDLNGKTEDKAKTNSETSIGTGEQSTDDTDADLDKPIFQAIPKGSRLGERGTIKGKPEEDKENPGQFFIRLGGKRYGLFFAGYRY